MTKKVTTRPKRKEAPKRAKVTTKPKPKPKAKPKKKTTWETLKPKRGNVVKKGAEEMKEITRRLAKR